MTTRPNRAAGDQAGISEWRFVHNGEPIPKGRPRMTKEGRTYTPKRTANAESELAQQFKAEVVGGPFPLSCPVAVVARFFTRSKTADLDNLVKLCLDSLNALAWNDDKQVTEIHATIERGVKQPMTELTIRWEDEAA